MTMACEIEPSADGQVDLESRLSPGDGGGQRRHGGFCTMSAAEGANLLLGLVAVVAVVSTLGGMACLFWVTRARRCRPTTRRP